MTSSSVATKRVVVTETSMTLVSDPDQPEVHAELRYVTREPFGLQLSLYLGDLPAIDWVFARDLLIQGVRLPAGHGDIQIYPTSAGVVIELHSPDGDATLLADGADLTAFADTIETVLPPGTEDRHFSLEAELDDLLAVADPWAEST